ncbi:MAG: helix-turn-helix domain-containing protein [Planctomycetota bacterium]
MPIPVRVLTDPEDAASLLGQLRRDVLGALAESPDSASGLSRRLGIARQKLNYHLRELEERGLIELDVERQRRGFTERVMRPAALGYVVSPEALGPAALDEHTDPDERSAGFLLGLCSRAIRELGAILPRAKRTGKNVPTLSIDTQVHFVSPGAREAFATDLAAVLAALVAKHSTPNSPGARVYRLVAFSHQAVTRDLEPLENTPTGAGPNDTAQKKEHDDG